MEVYHCAIVSTWTWWMGLHKPLPFNSSGPLSVCLPLTLSIDPLVFHRLLNWSCLNTTRVVGIMQYPHSIADRKRDAQWHCLWYIAPQTKQKRVFRSAGEKLGQMRIDDDWEMFNLANCCLLARHFIDATILLAWWFRSETVCFSSLVGCWGS